jgi:transcriptional regulator with XRE-family HTH domain
MRRKRRGHSQLDLAVAVHTTQRHVSFIESGRAAPSRDMILLLSAAMDISLRAAVDLGLCVTHEHWLLCAVCSPILRRRATGRMAVARKMTGAAQSNNDLRGQKADGR